MKLKKIEAIIKPVQIGGSQRGVIRSRYRGNDSYRGQGRSAPSLYYWYVWIGSLIHLLIAPPGCTGYPYRLSLRDDSFDGLTCGLQPRGRRLGFIVILEPDALSEELLELGTALLHPIQ
jgi:hypothetical protein